MSNKQLFWLFIGAAVAVAALALGTEDALEIFGAVSEVAK